LENTGDNANERRADGILGTNYIIIQPTHQLSNLGMSKES
jgi:hypothetical protein